MAETFEALRRGPAGFEQRVCIKRILPAFESDQEFVAAFLREATTSAQLRHTNIVQVLDFGVADGSHYLALELIDGMDLRKLSTHVDRLSADLVTLVAIDLASALHHAHSGSNARPSVVHRDISPSNVLVSLAGEVKLVDFGIAKALGGTHLTATGTIKGKIPYLPPEYIERGSFEPQGDLFSLGVMLFELLSGQRPFDGESDLDTIRRIAAGTRPELKALCKDAPDELVRCIEGLIVIEPAQRIASAAALLDALPMISVPIARRQLSELVRLPAPVPFVDAGSAPTQHAPSSAPRDHRPHVATRTSVRPATSLGTHLPSRRALYVLLAAVALTLSTLAAFLIAGSPGPRQVDDQTVETPIAQPPDVKSPQPTSPSSGEPTANAEPTAGAVPTTDAGPATPVAEPAPPERTATTSSPKARSSELRVVAIPFGDVWINGRHMGHAPVNARLSPGSYVVAVGDGEPAQRRTLRLSAGEVQNVVFRVETE